MQKPIQFESLAEFEPEKVRGDMAEFESSQESKPKKHPEKALTAVKIRNAQPGRHADGNGLYLVVDDSGAKRWVLRTVVRGKRCDIGLGGFSLVSLAEAREEAARLRKIARKHGDPLAERRKARRSVPTFEEAARRVHESLSASFRNAKHAAQWISTLAAYVFPVFGSRSVDSIESADVLAALTPVWNSKPETARRVRQRMKTVFDWAKASGYRSGDNPVEGVSKVLPKHNGKKVHHPALPYAQVPEFLIAMRDCAAGVSAKLAFEYMILTATRTSEVLLAEWNEIDVDAKTWTIPAERMKAKVEHRVPLSPRCLEILRAAREITDGGKYVFPGRLHKPLSNMVFEMTLRDRMNRDDITPHGFRSSFRDWAEEKTNTQRSVVEAALSHKVPDKVEAAYLRTTLFDKRRRLMDAWATYATTAPKQKVVSIGREA
jgi:integrase